MHGCDMKATCATKVHIFQPIYLIGALEKHVGKPPHADEDVFVP